jgi:hypothetical protein
MRVPDSSSPATGRFAGRAWQLLFALAPLLLLLTGLEIGSRIWLGSNYSGTIVLPAAIRILASNSGEVTYDSPLIHYDSEIGYSFIPGTHKIAVRAGFRAHRFQATIGPDGLRVTGPERRHVMIPEIWILGCSFTWGYMLNDAETYPWLIQSQLADYSVRNFGCNGCGTIQEYLNLKRASAAHKPSIAVIAYNSFHRERNTMNPAVLALFRRSPPGHNLDAGYPIVFIGSDGAISTRIIPVFSAEAATQPALSAEHARQLEEGILRNIRGLCGDLNIYPILAVQTHDRLDETPEFARHLGFEVVDISVPLAEAGGAEYTFLPLDPHPNARANQIYAVKLLPALQHAIKTLGVSGRQL